jgi:hypothetical protein
MIFDQRRVRHDFRFLRCHSPVAHEHFISMSGRRYSELKLCGNLIQKTIKIFSNFHNTGERKKRLLGTTALLLTMTKHDETGFRSQNQRLHRKKLVPTTPIQ